VKEIEQYFAVSVIVDNVYSNHSGTFVQGIQLIPDNQRSHSQDVFMKHNYSFSSSKCAKLLKTI
jgi:hypothetical protein